MEKDKKQGIILWLESMLEHIKQDHVKVYDFDCNVNYDILDISPGGATHCVHGYTGKEEFTLTARLYNEKRRNIEQLIAEEAN